MDRNIDERLRKPRRTKGTPFYVQRNYWAAGVIALSGLAWVLLELTPGFKSMKKYQLKYLSKDSDEIEARRRHIEISTQNPAIDKVLIIARQQAAYKDEPTPQGWLARLLSQGPDL